MKTLCLSLFWTLLCAVFAVDGGPAPTAAINFRVRDDYEKPVEGATIVMSTFHHWEPAEGFGKDASETFMGTTNADGVVKIVGASIRGDFSYAVLPRAGFYRGGGGEYKFANVVDSKWQPPSPTVDVRIKRIVAPIPMYARRVGQPPNRVRIPVADQPVGYDLKVGDWVSPYGAGAVSDLVFTLSRHFVDTDKPFNGTLTTTFSNRGDGIQLVENNEPVSEFKSPRFAPESGYVPKLVNRMGRAAADKPIRESGGPDLVYLFRVRTILDKAGHVTSALYGKIYGDFRFDMINAKPAYLLFDYYLNPTANDRNMEFDPKQNLFANVTDLEKPTAP